MSVSFQLNGKTVQSNMDPDTPLLWVLRDEFDLTGTKFGCGIGECGACTVHIGGQSAKSCLTSLAMVEGASVTTIEGLADDKPNEVQEAWKDLSVPQCGYCQSGQIMQATAFLSDVPNPTDEQIDAAMSGNLCRCMTYPRIRKAVHKAAALKAQNKKGA